MFVEEISNLVLLQLIIFILRIHYINVAFEIDSIPTQQTSLKN